MDSRAVQDFYKNVAMRNAVKEYFLASIEREALYLMFHRGDTAHLADAKDLIDKVFSDMEEFEAKPKVINTSSR